GLSGSSTNAAITVGRAEIRTVATQDRPSAAKCFFDGSKNRTGAAENRSVAAEDRVGGAENRRGWRQSISAYVERKRPFHPQRDRCRSSGQGLHDSVNTPVVNQNP